MCHLLSDTIAVIGWLLGWHVVKEYEGAPGSVRKRCGDQKRSVEITRDPYSRLCRVEGHHQKGERASAGAETGGAQLLQVYA